MNGRDSRLGRNAGLERILRLVVSHSRAKDLINEAPSSPTTDGGEQSCPPA